MSDPMLGEIRLLAFGRVPDGWHACDGSTLPYAANAALYSLIGTTYGGIQPPGGQLPAGVVLPDLRGRTPMAMGTDLAGVRYLLGAKGGSETSTLPDIPHMHQLRAMPATATKTDPAGNMFANADAAGLRGTYTSSPSAGATAAATQMVASTGSGAPFPSMQPFVVIQYVICTQGIVPTRP